MTRCCTLTSVTKILVRAISTVHAGRRFPTPNVRYRFDYKVYLHAAKLMRLLNEIFISCDKHDCEVPVTVQSIRDKGRSLLSTKIYTSIASYHAGFNSKSSIYLSAIDSQL